MVLEFLLSHLCRYFLFGRRAMSFFHKVKQSLLCILTHRKVETDWSSGSEEFVDTLKA